jgi:hypothetical protein
MNSIGKRRRKVIRSSLKTRFLLLLLFFGGVRHVSLVMAQSPGTFRVTGNITMARANHTATLLFNGKVLMTGGLSFTALNAPVASAELYDPSRESFTPTGAMTTARAGHTATLLPNGKVLITGGSRDRPLRAEVYDPSTGTFAATGDMITPWSGSPDTAVLLANGKVLIASLGFAAELYDPATGAFTSTGKYAGPSPEFLETATLLADGRVLITGGTRTGWSELYDPRTDTFSLTGAMNFWDEVNTETLLMNGKVLFVGESDPALYPADAEVYDPAARTFTRIGYTTGPRGRATAALLPDGTVLIAGGQLVRGNGLPSAELYASTTGKFSAAGNMTTGRSGHTATLLPDGTLLIAGGFSTWPYPTSSAEIYKPPVLQAAPVLLSLSGDVRGQGAIQHAGTYQLVSPANPAVAGEILVVYCTGLADGSVIPPQVIIGGRMAEVLFFGNTPGFTGLNQINVRAPNGVAPGPAMAVRLTYLARPSNEVTIGVR